MNSWPSKLVPKTVLDAELDKNMFTSLSRGTRNTQVRTSTATHFEATGNIPTSQSTQHLCRWDPTDLLGHVPAAHDGSCGDSHRSEASLWVWRRECGNATWLQGTRPYLSLLSGAEMHQFSWSCPLPCGHLPGRSCLSLLQGGEDTQSLQPTGQMPFGLTCAAPAQCGSPPLHSSGTWELTMSGWEKKQGRRQSACGLTLPQRHCKGNKKVVSFPVLAWQRHCPLSVQWVFAHRGKAGAIGRGSKAASQPGGEGTGCNGRVPKGIQ